MLEEIAIVQGSQPEVFERAIAIGAYGVVEFARMIGHERAQSIIEQSERVAAGDRLRERVDLLIAHLLVDVGGEQARRELGVLRFFDDERGRGLNRELVEFARARAVVEAADRLRGDARSEERRV